MRNRKISSVERKIVSRLFGGYKLVFQKMRYSRLEHGKRRNILVVGVQRSGTNMVMEVFDRGLPYAVFSESDARVFSHYELHPLVEVKRITETVSAPIVVLKPMTDTHKLGELLQNFPNSQGLWVYRRMSDVVNSHVRMWTGMPESLKRIRAERNWQNWRAGGISDQSYEIICEFAKNGLDNKTACAIFWYVRNVQFFEQNHHKDERVFLVPYDRFVVEPQESFTKLLNAMNVPVNPFMMQHIHAQSRSKNVPPAIHEEVAALCRDLGRRFDEHIEVLYR